MANLLHAIKMWLQRILAYLQPKKDPMSFDPGQHATPPDEGAFDADGKVIEHEPPRHERKHRAGWNR